MPKYVAFLRAINVGGHTVKMDYLRTLFEALGFTAVETFIASGNVIFDSSSRSAKALEKKIETSLQLALGYAVATFIRSTSELNEVAAYEPFSEPELRAAHSLHIGFMAATPSDAAMQKLLALKMNMDDFHLKGREVYWLRRTSFADSEFSPSRLEKTLGLPVTLRNRTTVRKIAAKYS
jgi:uncharacterized protein (DUF1697 family)